MTNIIENTTEKQVTEELNEYQKRRQELKALSQTIKPLVNEGVYETVNEAIIEEVYRDDENEIFNTFNQWKREGKKIVKGSKAFCVWGRPKKKEAEPGQNEGEDTDEYKYWPVAYLFSNAQVI